MGNCVGSSNGKPKSSVIAPPLSSPGVESRYLIFKWVIWAIFPYSQRLSHIKGISVSGPKSINRGYSASSSSAGNSRFSLVASGSIDDKDSIVDIPNTPSLRVFSFAELKVATKGFKPDTVLGIGGFGTVYRGWIDEKPAGAPSKTASKVVVAIKKLSQDSLQGFEQWQSEVNFLGSLTHPNLVRLLGYCWEEKELLLVYEHMAKGSLENHLFKRSMEPLPWGRRISIALGAARGLAFLHTLDKQVIYRDFKTSNILLDGSYNAKLSDFGLAKFGPSPDQSHLTTSVMGTYGYAAPEYVATGRLYVNSDVYGFGVVLLEMLTGLRAVDQNRPDGQQNLVVWRSPSLSSKKKLRAIIDGRLEGRYPFKAANNAAQLTIKCLQPDPRSRPSMNEVVDALQQIEAMGGMMD